MKTRLAIASVLLGFGGACAANAGLIDVAFYNSGYYSPDNPYVAPLGAAVLGQAGDQWNAIDAGNPQSSYALLDTDSTLTGVSLSFTSEGALPSLATNTQPVPSLTNNYLFSDDYGSNTVALTGLVANEDYDLVLYVSSNDASGGDRALAGSANGVSFSATGDPQTTFVDGLNVVELEVTADGTGTVSITENNPGNSSGEVDLNGLQLQSTPEPASFGLLCLGGAGLLLRRRVQRARRS